MRYNQEPYNQAMTGWLNQSNLAQKAAGDETASNNMQRQLLTAEGLNQDRDAALKQKDEAAKAALAEKNTEYQGKLDATNKRITVYQQNADTNKAKLDIMRASANGGVLQFQKDGTAIIVHKDGTAVPVTGMDGSTPVMFTPQDMQEMKDNAAMSRVNAQQSGANSREASREQAAVGLEGTKEGNREQLLKFKPGASNPYGSTTITTSESGSPNFLQRAAPGLFGTGITKKETTSVKTPNQAATNAQAYSPQIEQSIADAIKMHPDIYPDRASVIAALKAKGTIK
jgi:hypothetical protein